MTIVKLIVGAYLIWAWKQGQDKAAAEEARWCTEEDPFGNDRPYTPNNH